MADRLQECADKPSVVCNEDLKSCTLTFEVTNRDDEVILGFGPHYHEKYNRYPLVTTLKPFSGDLCVHEREWVSLPGPDGTSRYGKKWIFTLTES